MTIDLSKFCSKDENRTYLSTPWSAGEYSYATNGHLIVRVPRREDISERADAPKIDQVYHAAGPAPELSPLPAFPAPPPAKCETCEGSGWVVTCAQCDGAGLIECDECGQERGCPVCEDNDSLTAAQEGQPGAEHCDDCDGTGVKDDSNSRVKLSANLYLKLRYARWLRDLPNIRIALTRDGPDDGKPVHFVFDGGDGLIMPMRGPYKGEVSTIIVAEGVAA